MRRRLFVYLVVERDKALSAALGYFLMRSRLVFNALQEQPRALRHAPLPNIQKRQHRNLQRVICAQFF